jgi:hypothetical protein
MFSAPINAYGPGVHIGMEPEPILPELAQQDIAQAVTILADGLSSKSCRGEKWRSVTSERYSESSLSRIWWEGLGTCRRVWPLTTTAAGKSLRSGIPYVAQDDTSVGKLSILLVGCHAEHVSQGSIRADAVEVAARLAEKRLGQIARGLKAAQLQ